MENDKSYTKIVRFNILLTGHELIRICRWHEITSVFKITGQQGVKGHTIKVINAFWIEK